MLLLKRSLTPKQRNERKSETLVQQDWTPLQKKLVLRGVRNNEWDGDRSRTDRAEMGKGLRAQAFVRDPRFEKFADEWVKRFDCSEVIPPGKDEICALLVNLSKAPASAHQVQMACPTLRGSTLGLETLTQLELFMRRGQMLGLEFARSNSVCLPKCNEIGDDIECIKSASDVRPLGPKNLRQQSCVCCVESHSQSLCRETSLAVSGGCVAGRALLRNIPDLDYKQEFTVDRTVRKKHLLLMSFEIPAAFRSAALAWIWTELRAMLLPDGVLHMFHANYRMNVKLDLANTRYVAARVLQGCPLSGIVWIVDQLLQALHKHLDQSAMESVVRVQMTSEWC